MAKMSLLDMVQDILSDMNSDQVNSISDTVEADQVARIIRSTFYNLYNDRMWPHTASLLKLVSLADNSRPTHMKLADDVEEISWIKYDKRKAAGDPIKYADVAYMEPSEFLSLVMSRDASKSNAQTVIDIHGTPIIVLTDSAPTFWTMFDDEHLVFDSFDMAMDSVLQEGKTQVFGFREPAFLLKDTFVPDIPMKLFPYFLSECKSTASLKVKELFSQKDEQNSNRQKGWLSRRKRHGKNGIKYPDYGRK